jgi:hypothetical protein
MPALATLNSLISEISIGKSPAEAEHREQVGAVRAAEAAAANDAPVSKLMHQDGAGARTA